MPRRSFYNYGCAVEFRKRKSAEWFVKRMPVVAKQTNGGSLAQIHSMEAVGTIMNTCKSPTDAQVIGKLIQFTAYCERRPVKRLKGQAVVARYNWIR